MKMFTKPTNHPPLKSPPVDSGEIDLVNYLNIALMIMSLLAATYLPFEVFVFAYAVLGPLHYLTEISWLHDRSYFTSGRFDWIILLLPIIPLLGTLGIAIPFARSGTLILTAVAFLGAVGMTLVKSGLAKVLLIATGAGIGYLGNYIGTISLVLLILIPTVVHVYIFTGFFIVYGALKGRSFSGLLSAAIFVAAPVLAPILFTTPSWYAPTPYAVAASAPFQHSVS